MPNDQQTKTTPCVHIFVHEGCLSCKEGEVLRLEKHLMDAELLITEACYMAERKMGRERREKAIDNFNSKLKEYEDHYGK